ncbi:glycoside hydrolase superfamily [Pseudomassariella vexata]|uniref:glucan endo-1,6-beta-glucosidase n=1 Tax=Pseudomassariella vexata TaxID=1141098 RepID=A0A1Y2DN34_9PEZI|nr:glycoside hydrolase superfamily [Pseudomassariella vexata]ORY60657.1 glycoside hydrolase superfamily [Pseudomassariella vexata]
MPPYKIRGVNLGGWMISEPWMMDSEWRTMGCYNGNQKMCSEFDCVAFLGQATADTSFNAHYARWITVDDIQRIHDVGLNTIRIPLGYWTYRDIVYEDNEHFPHVDLKYLDNIIAKAASLGMFVVIDLHGAPFAQKASDAFTGQCLPSSAFPAFFQQSQYDRASQWLSWMTERIHNTPSYKATIGIIEVVNEPQTDRDSGGMPQAERDTLTQVYYPQALQAVRSKEASLNVLASQQLHVQFMDQLWGAGNPKSNLPSLTSVAFDDHNYVGGAIPQGTGAKQADYMWYTCYDDNRLSDGNTPKVVQEFSLTVLGDIEWNSEFDPFASQNQAFYQQWWIAQQRLYEKTNGWIFWTWKTQLGNPRWDYSAAVTQGFIPGSQAGLDQAASRDVCSEYFGN